MRRRLRRAVGMLAGVAVVGLLAPAAALANNRLDIFWTPTAAADQVTEQVFLRAVPPATALPATTYWSFGGYFTGGTGDDGWYMGLQTDGTNFQGQDVGQQAIFSVWNATAEKGGSFSTCASFSGEGNGLSCHVPFTVAAGHNYLYAVREVAAHTFLATITDETTGVNRSIGQITAPANTSTISSEYNFLEHFGTSACQQLVPAAAFFANPSLNDGTGVATFDTAVQGVCSPTAAAPVSVGVGAGLDTTYTPPAPAGLPQPPAPAPAPPAPTPPAPTPPAPTPPAPPNPAPPAPAPPPTPRPDGRVKIVKQREPVIHDRFARVRIMCVSRKRGCAGQLELTTGHAHHRVRLGTGRFLVGPDSVGRIKVKLTRHARRLLHKRRSIRARVSCSGHGTGNPSRAVTLFRVS